MPNDSIQNITENSAELTKASVDTVVVTKDHRAQYLGGFPLHGGNDTSFQRIDQMPVLEVPAAGNARTHNNSPLHDTGSMIMFLLSCLFLRKWENICSPVTVISISEDSSISWLLWHTITIGHINGLNDA